MNNEAGLSSHREHSDYKTETQKFREAITKLIQKAKDNSVDDGQELENEIKAKFGTPNTMPVHEETVQEVAVIMARHVPNFEIKFNGKLYPEKTN